MCTVTAFVRRLPVDLAVICVAVPSVYVVNISIVIVIYARSTILLSCIHPHVVLKVFVSILYRSVDDRNYDLIVTCCKLSPHIRYSDILSFYCSCRDGLAAGVSVVPLV